MIFSVLINRVRKLAGDVANNLITCPLCEFFFLHGEAFGINLLSVIRSNGVSVVEGFRMYGSLWRNNRDPKVCPLYSRCPPR